MTKTNQTKLTLTHYRARLAEANTRLVTAQSVVDGARVPDADLDTARQEPITVSGWYEQRTLSGRPAWRHYYWVGGRLCEESPTYDRAAHDELSAAGLAQYDAQQAYDDHHPASR